MGLIDSIMYVLHARKIRKQQSMIYRIERDIHHHKALLHLSKADWFSKERGFMDAKIGGLIVLKTTQIEKLVRLRKSQWNQ